MVTKTGMPNRRQVLLSGVASAAFAAAANAEDSPDRGAAGTNATGRLCLGLCGLGPNIGFCPFLNWQKMAGAYDLTRRSGGKISGKAVFDGGYVDVHTGEIANPVPADAIAFTRLFFAPSGAADIAGGYDFSGELWSIEWDGGGDCTIGGLGGDGSQSIDNKSRSGRFRFGTLPGNAWATFTVTDVHDPPRNIRIYQARYASNVAAGQTFNPDWLAQIGRFGFLRFMDWMGTNNSSIVDFADIADEQYFAWGRGLTPSSIFGRRGGMPLSLICRLANVTGCNVHFCIPHLATDACVRSIAAGFRDQLGPGIVTTFEYSNECWNDDFPQTAYCWARSRAVLPQMDRNAWFGYRSAQCMRLIGEVFNDRRRWRGCLAGQTASTNVAQNAIRGADYFLVHESPASKISDLFDEISVTGYFGDIQRGKSLAKISNTNPAIVTSPAHGYTSGQRLKLFVGVGMTELNNRYVTVGDVTPDTFALESVDATTYQSSVLNVRNYALPARIFELMDVSAAKHASDPLTYPTKYVWFNQVLTASWLTGSAEGLITKINIAIQRDYLWPAHKAIADSYGLDLRQGEGGLHYLGDNFLSGNGGNVQFTDYMIHIGHTKETAEAYAGMYAAFFEIGGHFPAKYVEAGPTSSTWIWAGMRFIPGDETNPVWVATLKANGR